MLFTKPPQTAGGKVKQSMNNNITSPLERTAAETNAGLKYFYWHILAKDSAVVKTHKLFSLRVGLNTSY